MNRFGTEAQELWVGHTLIAEVRGLITSRDVLAHKTRLCRRHRNNKGMKCAVVRYDRAVMLVDDEQAQALATSSRRVSPRCPVAYVVPQHILKGCRLACAQAASIGLVRGAFCEYAAALSWVQEMGEIHHLLTAAT